MTSPPTLEEVLSMAEQLGAPVQERAIAAAWAVVDAYRLGGQSAVVEQPAPSGPPAAPGQTGQALAPASTGSSKSGQDLTVRRRAEPSPLPPNDFRRTGGEARGAQRSELRNRRIGHALAMANAAMHSLPVPGGGWPVPLLARQALEKWDDEVFAPKPAEATMVEVLSVQRQLVSGWV